MNIMEEFEIKPNKTNFKNMYILIVIILGWVITGIGVLGKLNSTGWGGMLLNIGMVIQIIGYLLGIIKLFTVKKVRDFLNS